MRWLTILPFFLQVMVAPAQEVWTLERCIRTGLEHDLSVRRADLQAGSARLEQKRWTYAMLPTLNANLSGGYQFGRTIDPTSNSFIEATTTFGNGQVNASLLVFDGLRVRNSRRQAKYEALAADETVEDTRNMTALQVATDYIRILMAEELVTTAKGQREQASIQLEQTERLVNAGLRPEAERLAMASQLAQSEYQLLLRENERDLAYLGLKQVLLLEPGADIRIDRPPFDADRLPDPATMDPAEIYRYALVHQPVIRAAEMREKSAALGESIARSGLLPSVRLFGGLSNAYSNNFLDYARPDLSEAMLVPGIAQPVLLDGEERMLATYSLQGVKFNTLSFVDQLERNFGKSLGVNVSVPIYNNHTSRIGMQQARITHEQAVIGSEEARRQLRIQIETAHQTARAARGQYVSAREAAMSQRAAFDAVSRRFELGATNALELVTARTSLDTAENQLVIARYEYLFRMKVLDFYLGKPITLND